ncbi:hypothetical protein [Kitasatospora sp. NPDC101183]|uniref:hypothetical protein n=1 Tax=Kitasatospora sp. NPDC101183 TaxID=3364100 RepID=UPI003830BCE6
MTGKGRVVARAAWLVGLVGCWPWALMAFGHTTVEAVRDPSCLPWMWKCLAFAVPSGVLPGLAAGWMLAGPATAVRPVVRKWWAALAVWETYVAVNVVLGVVTDGGVFGVLAVIGAPVIAVIAAYASPWIASAAAPRKVRT